MKIVLAAALLLGLSVAPAIAQTGGASFYRSGHHTANGERFHPGGMTAAHRSLPFGTRARVTDHRSGRSVIVRINDRGPFVRGRIIDLAAGAAKALGIINAGHAIVSVAAL